MKRTLIVLSALTAASIPAPADAALIGGSINHRTPDRGYDWPIIVDMKGCGTRLVHEGERSDDLCTSEDVQAVFVRNNEQIVCRQSRAGLTWWVVEYDRYGWHKVGNLINRACVVQRD